MYGSSVASGTSLNCFAFETVSILITAHIDCKGNSQEKGNRGGEVEDFKEEGNEEVS